MDVNKYILELFPTDRATWDMYEAAFKGLFSRTSHMKDGTIVFYRDDRGNAGLDLYTYASALVEKPTLIDMGVRARMERIDVDTGLRTAVHYWMPPRSSIWKNGVTLANSIGVIDSSYRGNLMAAVLPIDSTKSVVIERGTRLVQIVAPDMGHICQVHLCPLPLLDTTARGEGGFGSTGR